MMQEDSNGESTFEFVENKNSNPSIHRDNANNPVVTTTSSTSLPLSVTTASSGNLLSNISPPATLPSFMPVTESQPMKENPGTLQHPTAVTTQPYHETEFSPVIPANKGIDSTTVPSGSLPAVAEPVSGGLLGWMKEAAVGTGGLLSKVAERARNSVDTMITTLDPQMREYLHSGGDIDIVVASDKEVKVSPIREAFQLVFGRATVVGFPAQAPSIAAQPVGFEAAMKAAEERISSVRTLNKIPFDHPVVAIENFLLEVFPEKWFDVGLLVLTDPERQLTLHTFTQMTPVPAAIVALAMEDTPSDYPLCASGFAVTIGSLMGNNLQVPHSQWHQALTGISRREMLLLASKALAGLYKSSIGAIL